MKTFLGNNYFITINKLPTIKSYWECGQYVGNEGIRNFMSRTRFEQILRNLHFADNQKDKNIGKAYKGRSAMIYFNDSFLACVSSDSIQSVAERMVKFKGRSSMRQYANKKAIKGGFKFWNRCASKTWYLYQFDLHLGKREENRGPTVILALTEYFEDSTVPFSLTISSTVHPLLSSFSTKVFTELVLAEWKGKKCQKWNQTNRWREVITNISLLTKLLSVNGVIDDQSQCCSVTFLACNQRHLFNCE